jgi:hypothetical protein
MLTTLILKVPCWKATGIIDQNIKVRKSRKNFITASIAYNIAQNFHASPTSKGTNFFNSRYQRLGYQPNSTSKPLQDNKTAYAFPSPLDTAQTICFFLQHPNLLFLTRTF